jgi:hypothetical protein
MKKWLQETHSPYFELLRHFLRHFFHNDLVSDPEHSKTMFIGLAPVILQWFFLLAAPLRAKYVTLSAIATPGPYRDALKADELWLITLMMSCIGLLVAIKWQSLFPDRRDHYVLGTLPIRVRQLFGAKLTALLLVCATTLVLLNLSPSLIFPAVSASRWAIQPSFAIRFRAHAIASMAGCAFQLLAFVALQGALLNVLPPRIFGRVTRSLQGALVGLMLAGIVVSFSIQPAITNALIRRPWGHWLPPVWFLGLYEKLAGNSDPNMRSLAHLATIGLLIVAVVVLLTYVASYSRHRTLLMEGLTSPGKHSGLGERLLALLFPDPRQQAIAGFVVQTLARSSHHRMIIMGYAGLGFAVISTGLIGMTSIVGRQRAITAEFLYFHTFTLLFLLIGARHLFSIPTELKANWIFQITEYEGRAAWLAAVDRLIFLAGAVLMLLLPAPFEIRLLGWRGAAEAALMIALALFIYERILPAWDKLPFTCSRLHGKTPIGLVMAFFGLLGLVALLEGALLEILYNVAIFAFTLVAILLAWFYAHKRRKNGWAELPLKFEDLPEPAVRSLNLLR